MTLRRTIFGLPVLNSLCVGALTAAALLNAVALALGGPPVRAMSLLGFLLVMPQIGLGALTEADRLEGRRAPDWAPPLSILGQVLIILSLVIRSG